MLYERYPQLQGCESAIAAASKAIIDTYENGGKLLCCGNGGSCADCDHIVGELMKGFLLMREVGAEFEKKLEEAGCEDAAFIAANLQGGLPAISLAAHSGVLSAFANDVNADMVYAQMVNTLGAKNDILLCLSTSGNSKNVVYAAKVAKAKGVKTICLTGERESKLSAVCDIAIRVPETETYKVQELHLPVYHQLCIDVEEHFFGK